MSDKTIRITVYGSLKRGGWLGNVMADAKFLGEITFKGTMVDLRSFPAVSLKGDYDIHGEVYEIDEEQLKRLDVVEGYPNFYQREEIDTKFGKSWVYTQKLDNEQFVKDRLIKSGNWSNHERN